MRAIRESEIGMRANAAVWAQVGWGGSWLPRSPFIRQYRFTRPAGPNCTGFPIFPRISTAFQVALGEFTG